MTIVPRVPLSLCVAHLLTNSCTLGQDPFGEERGVFRYEQLLSELQRLYSEMETNL
jgi:hypothetical protein